MRIDKLPKPGSRFSLAGGSSSFAEKLRSSTRQGSLKSIHENVDAVVDALKPYERALRRRGGLSGPEQSAVVKKIKQQERSLSHSDIRTITDVVAHLGQAEPDYTKGGDTKVPWYRRASRLEEKDTEELPQSNVSISQSKSKNSRVSIGSPQPGAQPDTSVNPLTGQPTSGGIGRTGPSVGSDNFGGQKGNTGGGPPMPLAR